MSPNEHFHKLTDRAHTSSKEAMSYPVNGNHHSDAYYQSHAANEASNQIGKLDQSNTAARSHLHQIASQHNEASRLAHLRAATASPLYGNKEESIKAHLAAAGLQKLSRERHLEEARKLVPHGIDLMSHEMRPSASRDLSTEQASHEKPVRAPLPDSYDKLPWEKQLALLAKRIKQVFGVSA